MRSILVLKLLHEWEATCWHSLRFDDIAFIVLCYRTTGSKNRCQWQVWALFITFCNTSRFFFGCWESSFYTMFFNFSPTFLWSRRLGVLIFPASLSSRWHSPKFSLSQRIWLLLTLYFLNLKNHKPFPHDHQQWQEHVAKSPPLKRCSSPPRTQFSKNKEVTHGFFTVLPSSSMAVIAPAKVTGQCTLVFGRELVLYESRMVGSGPEGGGNVNLNNAVVEPFFYFWPGCTVGEQCQWWIWQCYGGFKKKPKKTSSMNPDNTHNKRSFRIEARPDCRYWSVNEKHTIYQKAVLEQVSE